MLQVINTENEQHTTHYFIATLIFVITFTLAISSIAFILFLVGVKASESYSKEITDFEKSASESFLADEKAF